MPAPEALYVPFSSMGTVAGLCIGLALAGLATQIMAVQVVGDRHAGRPALARLLARIRHLLQQHGVRTPRSEEHTSELQSLMRISYAVFCLKKKKERTHTC